MQTVPDCETFTTPSIIFLDRKTGRPKSHIFKFAAEGWREGVPDIESAMGKTI